MGLLKSFAAFAALFLAVRGLQAREASLQEFLAETSTSNTNVELNISIKDKAARNATAPHLYGIMFEDISHSGDGGIYGELIRNRAFQGSDVRIGAMQGYTGNFILKSDNPTIPFGPVLSGWEPIGGVRLSLDSLHALSDALPISMQVDIPQNATGEVGFFNRGWWGFDVRPQTYTASFYVLANAPRYKRKPIDFKLSLRSSITGETWSSTKISAPKLPVVDYVQLNATLKNTATAPNSNNTFAITFDASQVAGHTLYFNLVSLFPETFKNRKNGLRKDLGEAFYNMKPKFLRFPGGNNLEGVSVQTRWKWWKTIGPLKDRPGRPADWSYHNTDGLGLLEYLEWCEDMEMEPVLAVYAGFSLDVTGQSGTDFAEDEMQPIVQEALDELEYCMGNTSTKYGALRAQHGHPKPFKINYIEIGNEDQFSNAYPYRWAAMYDGLKKNYPKITYISTTLNENRNYKMKLPPGTIWDTHHYEQPKFFLKNFNFYDNWQTKSGNPGVGVLLGEYSVYSSDTPDGKVSFQNPPKVHVSYPRMLSAIAEGVYALGGERNPNVVKMSSYAPSLQNLNRFNWTPNMIQFTANQNETILSTSYWQQWMFARYRGTHTLPVKNSQDFNPLFWIASIDEPRKLVYLKVINAGNQTAELSINIDVPFSSVNGTIMNAENVDGINYVNNRTAIAPRQLRMRTDSAKDGKLNWKVPKFSITILQFDL